MCPFTAEQRLHLPVRGVPEGRDQGAGGGADLGDVLHLGAVDRGELAADVGVGAVAVAKAIELMIAVDVPGAQVVRLYGAVALKLKALFTGDGAVA